LRIDPSEQGAGAYLRGAFCDVDQELVEIGGSDDGGGVGFQPQLHLGDFESDGFGDIRGGGRKKQSYAEQRQRKACTDAHRIHRTGLMKWTRLTGLNQWANCSGTRVSCHREMKAFCLTKMAVRY
jgi:hypothetical protein